MIKARSDKVFSTIRDRIIYGDYPPGMVLSEKDLCKEFKVSRTPLREAILKLKDTKLVTAIPGFGTHVTPIDLDEVRSAFQVKIKLEELVGELAAEHISENQLAKLEELIQQADKTLKTNPNERHRSLIEIDLKFHELMCQAAKNSILVEFQENIHSRCARLWNSSLSQIVPDREVIKQIKAIHSAVKKRDKKLAAELMAEHVRYFIDKIRETLL
jgi:DNA-binding GntR family transcriptional regulator